MNWREWFYDLREFYVVAERYIKGNHGDIEKFEQAISEEIRYQAFKSRLIEELKVELNCGLSGKLEDKDET